MEIPEIKYNISLLSVRERAILARWILFHLDPTDEEHEERDAIEAAWRHEIRQRVDEIRERSVNTISSDALWKELKHSHESEG